MGAHKKNKANGKHSVAMNIFKIKYIMTILLNISKLRKDQVMHISIP